MKSMACVGRWAPAALGFDNARHACVVRPKSKPRIPWLVTGRPRGRFSPFRGHQIDFILAHCPHIKVVAGEFLFQELACCLHACSSNTWGFLSVNVG